MGTHMVQEGINTNPFFVTSKKCTDKADRFSEAYRVAPLHSPVEPLRLGGKQNEASVRAKTSGISNGFCGYPRSFFNVGSKFCLLNGGNSFEQHTRS